MRIHFRTDMCCTRLCVPLRLAYYRHLLHFLFPGLVSDSEIAHQSRPLLFRLSKTSVPSHRTEKSTLLTAAGAPLMPGTAQSDMKADEASPDAPTHKLSVSDN